MSNISWNPEASVRWPLLFLVLIGPLPFASRPMWAWSAHAMGTAILLLVWAVLSIRGERPVPVSPKFIGLSVTLFVLVLLWIAIQAAPFTPQSWHHPLWFEAKRLLPRVPSSSIAVMPDKAWAGLARFLAYAATFWMALQCGRDRAFARTVFMAIGVAGGLYALYGLIEKFGGGERVLWEEKIYYRGSLTGTFISRNEFAVFAGLCLISLCAFLFSRAVSVYHGSEKKMRLFNTFEVVVGKYWYCAAAFLVLVAAILLTNSRAGSVTTAVGLVVLLLLMAIRSDIAGRLRAGIGFFAATVVIVLVAVSSTSLPTRFESTSKELTGSSGGRARIYELTLTAIADAPILGTGLGSFEDVFQIYRDDSRTLRVRAARAHNTYLENMLELGIPAALALFVSILLIAIHCFRGVFRRRRDFLYPAVGVAATATVGTHAIVDFSLQIYAIATTYSFLLGVACAQSWSTAQLARPVRPR